MALEPIASELTVGLVQFPAGGISTYYGMYLSDQSWVLS